MSDEYRNAPEGYLAGLGINEQTNVIVRKGALVTDEDEIEALRAIDQETNARREKDLERLGIRKGEDGAHFRMDQVVTNPIEKRKLLALSAMALAEAGFEKHDRALVKTELVKVGLDTHDGTVRKTLSDAQWLHAAAFHTDPHTGNIFAKLDDDGRVTGMSFIDNDTTFGKDARGKRLHYHADPGRPLRVANEARDLPSISAEFKQRLDDVNLDALKSDLEGLLSSEEIDATIDRIENLRKHAGRLEQQGKVLERDVWATDAGKPSRDPMQYANQLSCGRGNNPSPALLVARAEARLRAPVVEDVE